MSTTTRKTVTTKTYKTSSTASPGRTSPARLTRLQEKDELTSLNDRLAAYIDHIRSLERDNERLTVQIQTFEETSKREVDNVKGLYEKELAAARKLVDEIAKENAKLSVDVGTYKSEAEEWMRKYNKKDRELNALQKKYDQLEEQLGDLDRQLTTAANEKEKWQNEYAKLRGDVGDLERQLASARKQLEEESLQRVDLQNRVQSLKEELAFKSQLHQSELNETRTRMEVSMEEVDTKVQREYESKLAEALADFREQHEEEMRRYREDMEYMYESKISGLQKELADNDGYDEKIRIEISSYKSRISELQSQIAKLTNQNAALESRIASLEADLASERDQSRALYESKEREIRLLRQQLDEQMKEYQDLLDIKVSLDLEIAAYRKLLEGEEERLNISHDSSNSQVKVTPKKRKRDEVDQGAVQTSSSSSFIQETKSSSGFSTSSQCTGPVDIIDVDPEGNFVKIRNNSDKAVTLTNYYIIHKAGPEETDFKFNRGTKLGPGEEGTIWSADAGVTHDSSSHQYVMKGQRWLIADDMTTTLYDKNDQETAVFKLTRSSHMTVTTGQRSHRGEEEMFHQRGEPDDKANCRIM